LKTSQTFGCTKISNFNISITTNNQTTRKQSSIFTLWNSQEYSLI
jgi:hypothetical protein